MSSVIKRIKLFNASLDPKLWPLKKKAMLENQFRFFRGTCHLFAEDFDHIYGFKSKLRAWICGDLHFENFGSYKGQNRQVYFDISDFDEAILCTPHPDIARFLTSMIVAGEQIKATHKQIQAAVEAVLTGYVHALSGGKALMMEQNVAHGILKSYFEQVSSRDRESFIGKHTRKEGGRLQLRVDGVHLLPAEESRKKVVIKMLKQMPKMDALFSNLEYLDVSFRVAGTGSLGLQRYCVLCLNKASGKHYLIDVKQSRPSCYKPLVSITQPKLGNEAARTIAIEEMMQFNPPGFLSTVAIANEWYVVREMQPVIDKLTIEDFKDNFTAFAEAAESMAPLIAYAQLRSSGRRGSSTADELIKFASKLRWQKDILSVSSQLADKNAAYYRQFVENENSI